MTFSFSANNVAFRKTKKNGKFTKHEKISKSELVPKKKFARLGFNAGLNKLGFNWHRKIYISFRGGFRIYKRGGGGGANSRY